MIVASTGAMSHVSGTLFVVRALSVMIRTAARFVTYFVFYLRFLLVHGFVMRARVIMYITTAFSVTSGTLRRKRCKDSVKEFH